MRELSTVDVAREWLHVFLLARGHWHWPLSAKTLRDRRGQRSDAEREPASQSANQPHASGHDLCQRKVVLCCSHSRRDLERSFNLNLPYLRPLRRQGFANMVRPSRQGKPVCAHLPLCPAAHPPVHTTTAS